MAEERHEDKRTAYDRSSGYLEQISLFVISSLESFFYRWGVCVASHPGLFIIGCLVSAACFGAGIIRMNYENRPDKLWIPHNSEFVHNSDWLRKNFPSPIRFHYAIITADNVLEPKVLKTLLEIHDGVRQLRTANGIQWNNVCFRLPVTKFATNERKKREIKNLNTNPFDEDDFFSEEDVNASNTKLQSRSEKQFDPSFVVGQQTYCEILQSLDEECWESNILELWGYDEQAIGNLTLEAILEKINGPTISPVFGRLVNYTSELGDIKKNSSGYVVGAKAIMIRWFAKINQTALEEGKIDHDLGTGERVDANNLEWESRLSKFLNSYSPSKGVKLYFSIARSFGDIGGATIWEDASMFAVGFSIVFIHVIFNLGKCNMVEQRLVSSLGGLGSVGLAILVSYGICSAFRIIYGPVHNILPFLMMGIGIDDMFVIVQCWDNLAPEHRNLPLPERIGQALKHAGVSITVTSLTDFAAFAIGATTVLPGLQSFCIYAALGIVSTYFFQATFFLAWFVLDQARIEGHYNAFIICYKHKDYSPNQCSKTSLMGAFLKNIYCKFLFRPYIKVSVILLTMGMLGINLWGNVLLRQEFNPIWFLPQDSYLFQHFMARDKYYPEKGDEAFLVMHNVSLPEGLEGLSRMSKELNEFKHIHEIESWYLEFADYVQYNFKKDILSNAVLENEPLFLKYLGRFLFSPSGSRYRGRLKVNGSLVCGRPSPVIMTSTIGFKFKLFSGPEEHIPVMNSLKRIVSEFQETAVVENDQSLAFVWSFAFAGWETDEIIMAELYRNMTLAMVCVLITTLVLIANARTCFLVLFCVIFTLVDVAGSMHFWNLTIDTVSCIDLVLAIGLCVDYSAHIGHAFMTCSGSKDARAEEALIKIGPAVINGGFSTFLAFVLLANSKSHVFLTFYKIFFLTVFYGLYHGLVFLPVILSLCGPNPYPTVLSEDNRLKDTKSQEETELEVQVPLKDLSHEMDS